jgi:hypothetical protein
MAQESTSPTKSGFHGAVGTLPLVDLLQVWSMNRFSGLVTVTQHGRSAHLYFVEGEVVHAEADGLVGEPAVLEVICWPEGDFELLPNTATLNRTIQKRLSHLLLDAHRVLDEKRRGAPPAPPSPPRAPAVTPPPREPAKASVLDQIRAIRGVTQLVRFGPDGRPAGDASAEAEQLAANGLYLAMTHAAAVAAAFGLRDLAVATLQGDGQTFVLAHGNGNYLCVAVAPGVAAEQVAAQLRVLLLRPAGR